MSIREEVVTVQRHYCDGCGELLGGTIYGYGSNVELGDCCHRELSAFEHYKMRVQHAVRMIKAQPYFA